MMSTRRLINIHTMRTAGVGRLVVGRGFTFSTSRRMGLKESSSQTDVDNERHKQDSLEKQKKGKGHWKPELASDSEEALRADKTPINMGKLQEQTKRAADETAKAGTSVREGM